MADLSEKESAALLRLIEHAKRDTGHSLRVADFLLAWWNPANVVVSTSPQCGAATKGSLRT
jgi:hypothetical protein